MKVFFCFAVAEILFWVLVHFMFALNKIFHQKKTSYFFYRQYKIANNKGLTLVLKNEKKQLLLYKIPLRHRSPVFRALFLP